MKTDDKLQFVSVDTQETTLVNEFLLDDSDIEIAEYNNQKILKLPFQGANWHKELYAIHTYFTEITPDVYYGVRFGLVKNYSSGKQYSARGEEDLPSPTQKLLKFFLTDGTYIFVKPNDEEQCLKILISVNASNEKTLQYNTEEVQKTLIDFIRKYESR